MKGLISFFRQAFAPSPRQRSEPMWALHACPEAALAMRDWPLLPEREPESRAAREREIRRMASRRAR